MIYEMDSGATLPFAVNWADWLLKEGVSILTSTWTVPAGLTKVSDGLQVGYTNKALPVGTAVPNGQAYVVLSVLTGGQLYRVTNRITTTHPGGGSDERSMWIRVIER